MDRRRRIYEWLRRHPVRADAILVAAPLAVLGVPSLLPNTLNRAGGPVPVAVVLVVGLGMAVPLAWRRVRPAPAAAAVAAVALAYAAVGLLPSLSLVAVPICVYSLTAYGTRRAGRIGRAAALAGGVLYGARLLLGAAVLAPSGLLGAAFVALLCDAVVLIAWLLGDLTRARRDRVHDLEERARRLEVERDQEAALAAAAERARIAREMHDIVAHSLSVMIAQADGARYALRAGSGSALGPLQAIADTGRSTLADVRGLLGVLRDSPAGNTPQPGLADVPELVASVRAAGLAVRLDVQGSPAALSAGAGLAAYRVVQESLTNTIKHGGPAATAAVTIAYRPAAVEVTAVDDGRGAAADPADGRGGGIGGMRERVRLHGGLFRAGPRPGGGFEVRASFPYPPAAS